MRLGSPYKLCIDAHLRQPKETATMQPPGLPYAQLNANEVTDRSHLRVLSICHYVAGGLIAAGSSIALIHVTLGILLLTGRIGANPGQQDARWVGLLFVIIGSVVVLFGWTVGALLIFSGRSMTKLQRRTFSLVVACIGCMFMPLGTVLGVFTLIVLLRESVRRLYEEQSAMPLR